jgi:hypothetical protein
MDSYRRVRDTSIKLLGTDLSSLKVELEGHLATAMSRKPKDITLQSFKIPMGLSAAISSGESIESVLPFPLAGSLQDFMSFVPEGIKEVFVQVTVVDRTGSQRVETRLLDGFRSYSITAQVAKTSYAKIKIMNKTKVDVDCIFGFTFKEALPNEIEKTRLVGNLEGGTVS